MNVKLQELKSRLRGTWIHHAVWAYKNPPPRNRAEKYDWQTIQTMFRVLHRNSNCIDVGAHSGAILRHMVAIAPQGRHRAFEPLPHLAQILRTRFPQVSVHEAAVSDRRGESEFLFVESDPAYSGLHPRIYPFADPKVTTIPTATVTLDDVIPADEAIAFIKLDIEGGEFHALKGAIATILRARPIIVFEAGKESTGQYGVNPDDIYSLGTGTLGYEVSTMERWLERKPSYTREEYARNWHSGPDYYFIAVPRERRAH